MLDSNPREGADDAEKRVAFQRRLVTEFHITTLLVPVKTVAMALGMSPSTLYGYIRDGIFFLPYRLINKTPMIAVDDFVEWYCAKPANRPSENRDASPSTKPSRPERLSADNGSPPPAPVKDRDSARLMDLAVQEALKELGLREGTRRSRRK